MPKMTKYLLSAASMKLCHCSSTSSFQNTDPGVLLWRTYRLHHNDFPVSSKTSLPLVHRVLRKGRQPPPFLPVSNRRQASPVLSLRKQHPCHSVQPLPWSSTCAFCPTRFLLLLINRRHTSPNQPADDELQQTTLKEPMCTNFFHGSSTADHLPACLERTDQLESCGDKLQNPQQQEVGPEILQSDNFRGECIERGPLYFQNRAESFPSS